MIKSSEGLPNLGNTCFLNSILQGLFSVEKLREEILKERESEEKMSGQLKKIFLAIKEEIDEERKIKILKSFQLFLTKEVEDYIGYTQEDASFFLLEILNKLNEENEKYLKYFQFDTIQKCENKCEESNYMVKNQILFSQEILCSTPTCVDRKILRYLNRIPEAIFITEIKDKKEEIEFNVIQNWDNCDSLMKQEILENRIDNNNEFISKYCSKIKYSLRSIILYKGNKSSGHYISLRASNKSTNKFKLINDSYVSEEKNLSECNFSNLIPLIFIYEKKKYEKGENNSFKDKNSEKEGPYEKIDKKIAEKPQIRLNFNEELNKNSVKKEKEITCWNSCTLI